MITFGDLTFGGLTVGGMYAVFALCFVTLFRTAGVLNLAVGDFAMLGALGTQFFAERQGINFAASIIIDLVLIAIFAFLYDRIVLKPALEGRRAQERVVVVFFFTFGLSFFIENVGMHLFGSDVASAPEIWRGVAVQIFGLNIQRAGILTIGLGIVVGIAFACYLKFSLNGKALTACGQNPFGARIVGVRQSQMRCLMFITMSVLAAVFGIVISPITGFVYNTGGTFAFFGLLGAAFAAFSRPGLAVAAGVGIGLAESYLGGYVSTRYEDTLLYAVLTLTILLRPQVLGINPIGAPA